MAQRPTRSILTLESVRLADGLSSTRTASIDRDLRRGEVGFLHVADDGEAAALVDLCVGRVAPAGGAVRFFSRDWATCRRPQVLGLRRRIGAVIQTEVWPSQMTIMEAVLMAQIYHHRRTRAESVAEAVELSRLFGLPGLPAESRETTARPTLVRAGCVRGLLGSPDLVLVQDPQVDAAPELAVPMAQAMAAVKTRGAAALWIVSGLVSQAAQFVEADHVFRLAKTGLVGKGERQ